MTQTIPQPVLDVIATYCKTSKANVLPIIEHALNDYAKINGNTMPVKQYAEVFTRAILHGIDPDLLDAFVTTLSMTRQSLAQAKQQAQNPALMMQAQAMTPTGARQSPHSPKGNKGPKLPYWFKVVTSVDMKTPNGYGLKGKFVNESDIKHEQHGRIIVCQVKDAKTKSIRLHVLKTDVQERCAFGLPNGNLLPVDGAELIVTLHGYADLFDILTKNHGIPS